MPHPMKSGLNTHRISAVEQMWTHYKNSIGPKSKYAKDHYSIPIGRELFINSSNAQKLLQDDWQSKWIPDHLKEVKPKAKPKSAK